jgi:hypothetical protein
MLDYRNIPLSDVVSTIRSFGKSSKLHDEVINGLLAVAVFHSIKDGQVTPARELLAACSKSLKEDVSKYLTKYGNIRYTNDKGLVANKERNRERFGLDAANAAFLELPELAEAFPSAPKQYRDMDIVASFKSLIHRAKEVQAAGKSVIAPDDEAARLFEQMETYVASLA